MSDINSAQEKLYYFADFVLDEKQTLLFRGGEIVPMGSKSIKCLLLLIKNANKVVQKEEFFDEIWQNSFVEDGVLTVNISHIRRTFKENNANNISIETAFGKGYKFEGEVTISDLPSETEVFEIDAESYYDFDTETDDSHITIDAFEKNEHSAESLTASAENKLSPSLLTHNQILLAVLMCCFGLITYFAYTSYKKKVIVKVTSIAIFPFENISNQRDKDFIGVSTADNVNYALYGIKNVKVISIYETIGFFNKNFDPKVEGKTLLAKNVITGSYDIENNEVIVKLKCFSPADDSIVSKIREDRYPINNLLLINKGINDFILENLNVDERDESNSRFQQFESLDANMYETFLRGKSAEIDGNYDEAIKYLSPVLEKYPNFQPGLYTISTSYQKYGNIGGCGKTCYEMSAAFQDRLNKLNPEYRDLNVLMSTNFLETNKIEEAYRAGLAANETQPNESAGYFILGDVYRYAGILETSIEITELARSKIGEETPDRIIVSYLYNGDYENFDKSNIYPTKSSEGDYYRGLSNFYRKNFTEAKKYFESSYNSNPNILFGKISKVFALRIDNNQSEADILLSEINADIENNRVYDGELLYKIAQINSLFDNKPEALKFFKSSVENGFFCYPFFKRDSIMDKLRDSPEYVKLLQISQQKNEEFKANIEGK